MKRFLVGVVAGAVAVVVACGGQASFACGTTTCGGDEVCVHPCCGGAPPPCVASDDAGVCPAGSHPEVGLTECQPEGPTGGGTVCAPDACTPPPAYCAPKSDPCEGSQQDPQNCYEGCA